MSTAAEVRIINLARLMAKLGGDVQNVIFLAARDKIAEGAMMIHGDAVNSISRQPSQGRTYKRGNVVHVASAPGESPNTDTGVLVKSIKFEIDLENATAVVGTNLKYGAYLEMGTRKMAARPWLFPAFEKNKDDIRGAVISEVRKSLQELKK